jgi:hypothetical protein
MEIRCKRWLVKPYQLYGNRCWQVLRVGDGGRVDTHAKCYHVRLADALAWCAEYEMRNDLDQSVELSGCADAVRSVYEGFERAVDESIKEASRGAEKNQAKDSVRKRATKKSK